MRMQRLHWVKVVIEERSWGKLLKDDDGKKITYFMPQLMYIVILNFDKNGQLWLNSAYRVTEEYMRKKIEAQFGL